MLENWDEKMFAHYFFPFGEFPGDLSAKKAERLAGLSFVWQDGFGGSARRQTGSRNRGDSRASGTLPRPIPQLGRDISILPSCGEFRRLRHLRSFKSCNRKTNVRQRVRQKFPIWACVGRL